MGWWLGIIRERKCFVLSQLQISFDLGCDCFKALAFRIAACEIWFCCSNFLLLPTYQPPKSFKMAIVPARKMYFISDIDRHSGMWTVVVQVVESHRNQTSRANQSTTYKRLLLVDEHGTKVSGVLYDNDIQYHSTSLQPFNRYRISNAKLTDAFSHFKVGDYPYTWIINHETPVELVDEPDVPPIPFSYPTCPFDQLFRYADKDSGFHIKALAIHVFPKRQVTVDSTVREFVIVDESMKPMILGLWNTFGDIEGKRIADNITNTPIIIGVNMRATTFNGLSLSTRPYSCILTDPPLTNSSSLKEWYSKNKAGITDMLQQKAYKNVDLLLPPPKIEDTMDVPTAVDEINRNQFTAAWVIGEIRFAATKQAYHYCACDNCNKKVIAAAGWTLKCSKCDQVAHISLRTRVPMELTKGDKSFHVVMSSPNVETLTGITAEQLRDSHELDLNVYQDLQMSLDNLRVVCFVRKYDVASLGKPTNPKVQYSVVKAYTADALQNTNPLTAVVETPKPLILSKEHPSSSVQDAQLFGPDTTKKLTQLEGIPVPEKTIQPNPQAKRSIDFMSADTTPTKSSHPSSQATPSGDSEIDPGKKNTTEENPVKKGRDKQKMT